MRAPETTRPALVVALALALLGATSCSTAPADTGRAPEGTILPSPPRDPRSARAGAAGVGASADDPGGDPARIGVTATHRFHRAGCPQLEKVPAGDRTPFASCWEAINADLAPCPECRPGPPQQ